MLKAQKNLESNWTLSINDGNAACKYLQVRPHLEKFHERKARSADNELWWRAPSVINIVSMHRSIITIRSNTRRPRARPDASLGYHSRLLPRKGCLPPQNSTWGYTTFIPTRGSLASSTPLRARNTLLLDPLWLFADFQSSATKSCVLPRWKLLVIMRRRMLRNAGVPLNVSRNGRIQVVLLPPCL